MRILAISLMFAALGVGGTAQAADQPTTPPAAAPAVTTAEPADDGDKTVCKNVIIIGSHFTRRVCAKVSQWGRTHESSVEELDRNTQHSLQGGPR